MRIVLSLVVHTSNTGLGSAFVIQNCFYMFGTNVEFRRALDNDLAVKRAFSVLVKAKDQKEAIASAK